MNITNAQSVIIRNVCKLQSESALRLVTNNMQIPDENSYQYKHLQRLVQEYNIDNMDLLDSFTDICQEFDALYLDPTKLDTLGESSLRIFNKILNEYAFTWINMYPNAHKNMINIVNNLILGLDNENINLN